MATIGSLGVGSGLDLNTMLTQLMEIEKQPLYQLQSKQKTVQTQISAFGTLKSAISSFQSVMDKLADSASLKSYGATSSTESVLTVSAGSSASSGNFDVEVTQLAKAHKVASLRLADSDTTAVGTTSSDSLDITVDGVTMSLSFDGTATTLEDLRDLINNSSENPGVTASIINEGGGSRLMLSSDETGADYGMSITPSAGLGELLNTADTADGHAQTISSAQDAAFTIDTFSLTSSSNTVTDALGGVTFTLKSEGSSTVAINRDDDAIVKTVQEFVDAYNTLKSKMSSLRTGDLKGDFTIGQLDRLITSELSSAANLTGFQNLFEVGVTRDRYGKLSLNSDDLKSALTSDFSGVVSLFSDEDEGFASRLSTLADDLTGFDGVLADRTDGLNSQLRRLGQSEDRMNLRLEGIRSRYQKQFSALDASMSKLNSTSSYLSSQLMALYS